MELACDTHEEACDAIWRALRRHAGINRKGVPIKDVGVGAPLPSRAEMVREIRREIVATIKANLPGLIEGLLE